MSTLLAWIGFTDVKASNGESGVGAGPIAEAVLSRDFDEVILLSDLEKAKALKYAKWLKSKKDLPIQIVHNKLSGPTNFGEIYTGAVETIERLNEKRDRSFTYHLSPGTPAMAAVWIIIAKTRFPAELIESSKQEGVKTVSVPFDISAEFLPSLVKGAETELERISVEFSTNASTFENIIHQSQEMGNVVRLAQRLAIFDAPVLIEGESGTGKELFAKAIHRASIRKDHPFVAVNCGAIPSELVESELFGHEKGAFTGATSRQVGKFAQAQKGTIFLDEVGELPLPTQAKLLRVTQEKEITPVGASKSQMLDVRIISATNRKLMDETAKGLFREDLFYRLAIFPMSIPPLRNRVGDLSLLIKHFLKELNSENTGKFWNEDKTLSPKARTVLLNHSWPGNVRELQATLLRAAIYSRTAVIGESDVNQSVFSNIQDRNDPVSLGPITDGFNIKEVMEKTAKYYLTEALKQSHGNKSQAAKLLGLPSYQTFLNWWRKYVGE